MAKRRKAAGNQGDDLLSNVQDYRHETATRKNNPPAKIAAEGTVPVIPRARYHFSPRRPPELRFDPHGGPDVLPELIEAARTRPLTDEEAQTLAAALRAHEPWLEWAEKREQHLKGFFEVDPVALHIHERVSTQAILKVAARQDPQRDLFADPQQEYREAVQFYKHDVDWSNRLILGDSLQVMSSLARREDLAGKVQMIYMDPPYGIKFASNFQPEIGRRDVKDKDQDLTREPEMVKAYRDTWHLGVHSYLSYLRDRLMIAKELLADTGSIFVQISDENLHRVKQIMDEVFGIENCCPIIMVWKTSSATSSLLATTCDFLLWYVRNRASVRFNRPYIEKDPASADSGGKEYRYLRKRTGEMVTAANATPEDIREGMLYRPSPTTSQSGTEATRMPVELFGQEFKPGPGGWKTNAKGFERLGKAERLIPRDKSISYLRFLEDFPVIPVSDLWMDARWGFDASEKRYVVETNPSVIQRCILMTTDPGDLVLDPTCGSGTTAYVAEQWGRRWITVDTSRVAVAIARQRLLTAKYDYYALRDEAEGLTGNLKYKTVPHITLKSIAQNTNLDPIFAKHEPILDERLAACNKALKDVTDAVRKAMKAKMTGKLAKDGKRAITDADRRRWELPSKGKGWAHWEVPFVTDSDWPKPLQKAVTDYRAAWRAKMDEVNACIEANADQEELVDQPEVVRGVTRVSGPFTVEAVQPPALTLGEIFKTIEAVGFDGEPDELEGTFADPDGPQPAKGLRHIETLEQLEAQNVDAYLDKMTRYLRNDGVRFPNNKQMRFTRLEAMTGDPNGLHAEGRWAAEGTEDADPDGAANVCVAFGPQYGPVTAKMVEELIKPASRHYDDLVIAGFAFDGPAQATIEEAQHPKLHIHMAHIRPDVNPAMDGLLKEPTKAQSAKQQASSQLFTVFGQPRTRIDGPDPEGNYTVTMEGMDIYDPVSNEIVQCNASKVAAWFIDGDYDGRTFCITQAFFPDRTAWDKLARALKDVLDADAFEALSGTTSLPFPSGANRAVAIKVIDPRGNEVMKVHKL
jgi:adenine-specific DNA-methyltransferase